MGCDHQIQLSSQTAYSRNSRESRCGWVFLWVHPTHSNLQRHSRPSSRFLLQDGEAAQLIADLACDDLEIIDFREGWQETDRYESVALVQKTAKSTPGYIR